MSVKHVNLFFRGSVGLFFLLVFQAGTAQDGVGNSQLLLSYTQVHDMIAEPDKVPLLRLYDDGRVLVHYPMYMKKAGDYEQYIPAAEAMNLVAYFENGSLADFDRATLQEQKQRMEALRRATDKTLYYISDDTHTVFQLYPEDAERKRTITWTNLQWDNRRYPQITELEELANLESVLQGMMNDPDLEKIQ